MDLKTLGNSIAYRPARHVVKLTTGNREHIHLMVITLIKLTARNSSLMDGHVWTWRRNTLATSAWLSETVLPLQGVLYHFCFCHFCRTLFLPDCKESWKGSENTPLTEIPSLSSQFDMNAHQTFVGDRLCNFLDYVRRLVTNENFFHTKSR